MVTPQDFSRVKEKSIYCWIFSLTMSSNVSSHVLKSSSVAIFAPKAATCCLKSWSMSALRTKATTLQQLGPRDLDRWERARAPLASRWQNLKSFRSFCSGLTSHRSHGCSTHVYVPSFELFNSVKGHFNLIVNCLGFFFLCWRWKWYIIYTSDKFTTYVFH